MLKNYIIERSAECLSKIIDCVINPMEEQERDYE